MNAFAKSKKTEQLTNFFSLSHSEFYIQTLKKNIGLWQKTYFKTAQGPTAACKHVFYLNGMLPAKEKAVASVHVNVALEHVNLAS